jgi:hypothetical protein
LHQSWGRMVISLDPTMDLHWPLANQSTQIVST